MTASVVPPSAADADPTRNGAPIRVLVVDDHELFLQGLQVVLDTEDDISVVGRAADGQEALVLASGTAPDIVLMDVRMPGRDGIAAAGAIKRSVPRVRVVMLTVSDEESDLFEAIKAGAVGYLLKSIPPHEVADAVRAVHSGQSLISPSMASKLMVEFATMARGGGEDRPRAHAPHLTARELEVLKLVAEGRANREIARKLFISENTVKNHVRNILDKLQLHSRMEAVMYAVRQGLFDIE
ncbi:DNA-binding response regulator [Frankia sp. CcI49]|uniref:DNA-binding response regulator, NarL/FixJ family, contains REC and HTH domains n=1 Tax=Parafrankia irregularis TaxID=795642 RepID=A0A0S4QTU2_9ACTN|nr:MULTISPECIES: response regulator transcription factor [Frankiaceae]EFC80744.1 two component transcriptional regulator, LuxR family [Parafrankia sp. EUN1f]KPM56647.1 chemotaxis protein CheY [Frankia sp. R43]MBE3202426.1 response regulator transcription factor [Parafrankia sp. CH37]ONH62529.1 DNA-binding response regulator [Frankia sp. CcI49]CUU58941.1 DNA-binding response regulator, NarL/FixJ family, contains REC and HTH domains [Parafrankia irregularis]